VPEPGLQAADPPMRSCATARGTRPSCDGLDQDSAAIPPRP